MRCRITIYRDKKIIRQFEVEGDSPVEGREYVRYTFPEAVTVLNGETMGIEYLGGNTPLPQSKSPS